MERLEKKDKTKEQYIPKEIVFLEPSPTVKKLLNETHKKMRESRDEKIRQEKEKVKRVRDNRFRKCNSCKEHFPVKETLLLKRTETSERKFRFCIYCHTKKNIGIEE